MTTLLVQAITVVAALLAVLGLASTAARRRIGLVHLAVAGVLELLLLVQAGLAVAAMVDGVRPEETATFVSYLGSVLLVPIAGALWARSERTRWAGAALAIAGAVVGVMVWRLLQLWEVTRA
ncbi:MAG TPA: hypothetical protein VK402_08045 [Blastococcus sp.]|nr:hypothetical protein [Blastococcus sp.]